MSSTNLFIILNLFICINAFNKIKANENNPKNVYVSKKPKGYSLIVEGKEYYIKGAGGHTNLKRLKAIGGNSIRTWSATGAQSILDSAYKNGLTVTLGIEMSLERQGFSYNDKNKVKDQFERIKREINQFKNHPALLIWGIGNELELNTNNYKIWDAVEEIASYIHINDKNHPVTTMLAGVPQNHIKEIKKRCQSIDILSINAFKDIPYVKTKLIKSGWTGPYMITEWGTDGYWESELTTWGAFIEPTSSQKAEQYRNRYKLHISPSENCLGSYVFYWGYKQERTHTVFSIFIEKNLETEAISVLHEIWKGNKEKNTPPKIDQIKINNGSIAKNIILEPNKEYYLSINATDNDNDMISYSWEIYFESNERKAGGDKEIKPPQINCCIKNKNKSSTSFVTPEVEGPYRIFVYAYDEKNHIATANLPILIKKENKINQKKQVKKQK
ncbi:MAG: glycoside hydrolase family 2 TIM barrel-domain containing protein [Bacteroidota bacterium]|jgi:hypothetical protein